VTKLCVVQPLLSHYSRNTFVELAEYCHVDIVFSPAPIGSGFGYADGPQPSSNVRYFVVPTFKPLGDKFGMFQWGIGRYLLRERPDALILSADQRYLSFWAALLWARVLRIRTYAHGHGVYKKRKIGSFYRLALSALLRLVNCYICYAPIVRDSLTQSGFDPSKLTVAHNSLTNLFTVSPEEKTGKEMGILFLGRLRANNGLQLLLRVIERLRKEDGLMLILHAIGTGAEAENLRQEARGRPWAIFHGEIYDQKKIREVSLNCFAGCYPGNAGLSVVHMMSLSLPVITHNDLQAHGPEPSFIVDGVNGILYDRKNDEESLYKALKSILADSRQLKCKQVSAFNLYQQLVNPPLAARMWSIISDGLGAAEQQFPAPDRYKHRHRMVGRPKTR
jgi:glycosyltransferase involved in cell wall biosynthesis